MSRTVAPIRLFRAGALALVAAWLCTPAARADLHDYVAKPDAAYQWALKDKKETPQGLVYDLELVSQVWQGIPWKHQLHVYQPKDTKPTATMLLWNTGGSGNANNMAFGMEIARRCGAPIAILYHIPNQPLFGGKKEDALIAETFVRYLDSKDGSWPLLFPMVKSVVRAMDAVQAFARKEWQFEVKNFVISGASKRGWTTWLTAASGDPRVKAIAPFVIDTLNMKDQMPRQLEQFGRYSEMIHDYTERGLVPMPDTPEAKKLWSMVDPWLYRDKLTMPKLIVNGTNDPYWTVDATNVYWDDLKGDKWVLYVPNAGHNLQRADVNSINPLDKASDALNGLAAFVRHVTQDNPMPKLTWKHDERDGKLRLTVEANPAPTGGRLWVATNAGKDFRPAKWHSEPVKIEGGKIVGEVNPPADGYLAFYAELDYEIGGLKHHLCTQIRVTGAAKK